MSQKPAFSSDCQRGCSSDISHPPSEQQRKQQREERISKCVVILFGVVPIVVMIGIFLLFSLNDSMKHRVVGVFTSMQARGIDEEIACYLLGYGALLVFLSFPYVIFEMSLGFTFPVPQAIFFAIAAKLLGEVCCYVLSRYLLKSFFLKYLRMNGHFRVIEGAVKKFPWTVSHLLRASILVPLFVINFGSGIINLTFAQYILPAIVWGALYSVFSVLCGSQLVSIQEVIENSAFPKNKMMFIFEISMIAVSLIIIVAAIWKSGKIYDEIKTELDREQEEEAAAVAASANYTTSIFDDSAQMIVDSPRGFSQSNNPINIGYTHKQQQRTINTEETQELEELQYFSTSGAAATATASGGTKYQQFYRSKLDEGSLPVTTCFTALSNTKQSYARTKSMSLISTNNQ